ncbi:MAG: hypothetical protein DME07_04730 [Candidatus Rokuibacteriota bacterium]|nr:MAG: hypothetical protein DME07_04730 [Candidatus Rokubacteria bacterium]
MITTAGNGPGPAGFESVAGIWSAPPVGDVVAMESAVPLAQPPSKPAPSAIAPSAWQSERGPAPTIRDILCPTSRLAEKSRAGGRLERRNVDTAPVATEWPQRSGGAARYPTARSRSMIGPEEASRMKTVVALPGQGIGVEVVDATCEILAAAGMPLKILTPPQTTGSAPDAPVPDETKRACREADAVLFGAAGPATTAVVAWLRWEMEAWGGVRPSKFYTGMRSPLTDPEGIDFVVIRENSEGLYPGREGDLADAKRALPNLRDRFGRGLDRYGEGAYAVKVVTRRGAERIARLACQVARRRKADTFEHFHVDDAARRLIRFPKTMDVVVSMNQYADILSDIAGEVAGGLGVAPSANFGDEGWAYFESVHGSAPDIAGKGIANPTATILSAVLLLDHVGLAGEAKRLETALARVYRDGKTLTPDQGGAASTKQMSAAVLAAYRNQ